jgi:hypothetical protein
MLQLLVGELDAKGFAPKITPEVSFIVYPDGRF